MVYVNDWFRSNTSYVWMQQSPFSLPSKSRFGGITTDNNFIPISEGGLLILAILLKIVEAVGIIHRFKNSVPNKVLLKI